MTVQQLSLRLDPFKYDFVQLNQPNPILHVLLQSTMSTFLLFNAAQTTESNSQDHLFSQLGWIHHLKAGRKINEN